MVNALLLNEKDNVLLLLQDVSQGCQVEWESGEITALSKIPFGHKAARIPLKKGEAFLKYGEIIGYATCDIPQGDWVHVHNLGTEE